MDFSTPYIPTSEQAWMRLARLYTKMAELDEQRYKLTLQIKPIKNEILATKRILRRQHVATGACNPDWLPSYEKPTIGNLCYRIMLHSGGKAKVGSLARVLEETGKISADVKNPYALIFSSLKADSRFFKSGAGEFSIYHS